MADAANLTTIGVTFSDPLEQKEGDKSSIKTTFIEAKSSAWKLNDCEFSADLDELTTVDRILNHAHCLVFHQFMEASILTSGTGETFGELYEIMNEEGQRVFTFGRTNVSNFGSESTSTLRSKRTRRTRSYVVLTESGHEVMRVVGVEKKGLLDFKIESEGQRIATLRNSGSGDILLLDAALEGPLLKFRRPWWFNFVWFPNVGCAQNHLSTYEITRPDQNTRGLGLLTRRKWQIHGINHKDLFGILYKEFKLFSVEERVLILGAAVALFDRQFSRCSRGCRFQGDLGLLIIILCLMGPLIYFCITLFVK